MEKQQERVKEDNNHDSEIKETNYRLREKKVSGESTSLGARPCWGPSAHRGKKHTNKRIIYWRRKEGEAEWRDERRGNTVQRHLRAVWVKHWPHLNIHSQCVTFSPTLHRWRSQQSEPIWSHCGSLRAFLFKIHRPLLPPTWPPFPNKTNTPTYGCRLMMVHFHVWNLWKPSVELSQAALTARSHDEFLLMP